MAADREEGTNKKPDSKVVEGSTVIPVIQEFLKVGKETVETGKVIAVKKVLSDEKVVSGPVSHDEIDIERIPIGQYVKAAPKPFRYEGDTLVIPVVKEELVVQKRLLVVEELRITKRVIKSEFEQQVTLRREEVEIKKETNNKTSRRSNQK
jgi:uncharacterized protein (TIGR02271 family)